jgi:hypothetical protein
MPTFVHLQGQVTVFNLDPETSNEQLVWLFSKFGDVQVRWALCTHHACVAVKIRSFR